MAVVTPLPARRPDLVIKPLGDDGRYVIKDSRTGEFFQLGQREHFLLTNLDGVHIVDDVCADYEAQFGEPLPPGELDAFVEVIRAQGLLEPTTESASTAQSLPVSTQPGVKSILHWRTNLWDPDRFFTWLAPRIWFFWTPAFVILSAASIVVALFVVWANRQELASTFVDALRWEVAILAWLTIFFVTLLHECAHGLTCKHYGGEVHEIGFLLMYLLPCFYCNVSDAWLFKDRSKRLWVTFAGGYFELCLWALAVFAWRATLPGTFLHYLAFAVLSVCGIQTLFNLNPLMKLDGYYLLSDWLEIPNLQGRALGSFKGGLRWLLWGAQRPETEPRARLLLGFGAATWIYSLVFLGLTLAMLFRFAGTHWGWVGMGVIGVVGLVATRSLFHDLSAGEVTNMIQQRHKRKFVWLLIIGAVMGVLYLVEIEDWASGSFQVCALTRTELRAPVAGFLREIYSDEGDTVSPGTPVVRLEIPDLSSKLVQKQAETREAEAKLRLLEAGPRPEEIVEQRRRVERAEVWHDLARKDMARLREVCEKELARMDMLIAQCQADVKASRDSVLRGKALSGSAISAEQLQEAERRYHVCQALLGQAQAEKNVRAAKGTIEAETEVARREKELADVCAALVLLEVGPRALEVEAARANLARLQEEMQYLDKLRNRLSIYSYLAGIVTTPRLKEKIGQYMREGELICVIEEPAKLAVEITVAEQVTTRLREGQPVALRPRALSFATLHTQVTRIAAIADPGEAQSNLTIHCSLDQSASELRPGMTGHARIYTGSRQLGAIIADRALCWLRTEFWWW